MAKKYKVRVYHAYYGCDTGCCGHYVEMTIDDKVVLDNFHFAHVYKWNATQEDVKEWAIDFAKEEIGKKFPECLDSINWDTIDITEVCDD